MKFDCIIANPPFQKGLHTLFESKFFDICNGQICWISPLNFILGKVQNKELTSKIDKVYTEINQVDGSQYFDADLSGTMGICFFDMNKPHNIIFDNKQYNKCKEISFISNDKYLSEFKSIVDNIIKKNGHIESYFGLAHKILPNAGANRFYIERPNKNWYVLSAQRVRGHGTRLNPNNDFYTLISNDNEFISSKIGLYRNFYEEEIPNRTVENNQKFNFNFYIHTDTLQELYNIINYLKTDFCRACIYLMKNSISVDPVLSQIPKFDFTDSIFEKPIYEIDNYLFSKYKVNKDLQKHLKLLLPDYYGTSKNYR